MAEDVALECLVEWVAKRVAGRQVMDVIPPSTYPADYPHPALVLERGWSCRSQGAGGDDGDSVRVHRPISAGLNSNGLIRTLTVGQYPL